MSGQITGTTGITAPQTPSSKGAEQPGNLTASRPSALNRTSITTHTPRKNLVKNSEPASLPASTPLADRQAAIKSKGLKNLLNIVKNKIKSLGHSSRPAPTPATGHQAATRSASPQPDAKPQWLSEHLKVIEGKIETLKNESPTDPQEKKLHKKQIKETLKDIKQLSKNLKTQYKEVILQHGLADMSLGTETPENKAEYQKISRDLDVINGYIKTLKAMG